MGEMVKSINKGDVSLKKLPDECYCWKMIIKNVYPTKLGIRFYCNCFSLTANQMCVSIFFSRSAFLAIPTFV